MENCQQPNKAKTGGIVQALLRSTEFFFSFVHSMYNFVSISPLDNERNCVNYIQGVEFDTRWNVHSWTPNISKLIQTGVKN